MYEPSALESCYVQAVVDARWLVELFQEVGLEPDQAERAAAVTLERLLQRQRPPRGGPKRTSLLQHMVRDPLVSVNRIIGKGDEGLPFVDPDTGTLSTAAFSDVLGESGLDPVVSMAFAKVVVEAFEPKELYQPVWEGLGKEGDVDLDGLRKADWTPLRRAFPELAGTLPPDLEPTRQVPVKPKAKPPGGD